MIVKRLIGSGLALAWVALGSCSLEERQMRVPLTTSSDDARRFYIEGRDALDALRLDEARDYFTKAAKKDPGFALAHLALAETAPTEPSFRESLKLAVMLSKDASRGERLMILAAQAAADGDSSTERDHLTTLTSGYPDDERAQIRLGDSYFRRQKFTDAVECYERALEIEPGLAVAQRRLGDSYRLLDRYDDAEKVLSRYREDHASEADAHALYARLLMKMGRFDESIASYEKVLALAPDDEQAQVGIGNCLLFMGRSEKALQAFRKLHDQAADDAQRRRALVWMASTHLYSGARDEALSILDQAVDLAGSDPETRSELLGLIGDVLLETGSPDEALARFGDARLAIEQAPLSDSVKHAARVDHLYREARVAAHQGDLETAQAKILEYRRTLTRGAFEAHDFNKLKGLIALARRDHRRALKHLELSDQSDPVVVYLLAETYSGLGRAEDAVATCRRVVEFNEPRFELAYVRPKAQQLMETLTTR